MKRPIEFNGITDTVIGWSRRTGIPESTIRWRLDSGWDVERVLLTDSQASTDKQLIQVLRSELELARNQARCPVKRLFERHINTNGVIVVGAIVAMWSVLWVFGQIASAIL